jgi:hypothetical protein
MQKNKGILLKLYLLHSYTEMRTLMMLYSTDIDTHYYEFDYKMYGKCILFVTSHYIYIHLLGEYRYSTQVLYKAYFWSFNRARLNLTYRRIIPVTIKVAAKSPKQKQMT